MSEREPLVDLGPLEAFPEGTPLLRKHEGRRFVCVRRGGSVDVLDDRCPHQGYPLSRGRVADGVLTCEWHNWKFELATGGCLFGGEPAHRYPTRVEGGRVALDLHRDVEADAARYAASLKAAVFEVDLGRAVRDALRLDEARGGRGLREGFSIVAKDGAERAPWGFDHALAVLADLFGWAERGVVDACDAFAAATFCVAEMNAARPRRVAPEPGSEPLLDASAAMAALPDLLASERRGDADVAVRFVVRSLGPDAAFEGLAPFVARHLYDYGHSAIYLLKAREIADRAPAAAEEIFAACAASLGWATAETALPPFTETRRALDLPREELGASRAASFDRDAFERAVLEGERTAVEATLDRLREGCDAMALLRATAHAAAVRLSRFDPAWAFRVEVDAGVLDVTHLVTFSDAALGILARLPPEAATSLGPRFAIQAAGFVGKLRRGDRAGDGDPPAPGAAPATLEDAMRKRDASTARAIARALEPGSSAAFFDRVAPFAAFEAAIRPIFIAHAVKTTEALRRLAEGDPNGGSTYLEALAHYLATPWPESRIRRTAAIARKFLADGRPPERLY